MRLILKYIIIFFTSFYISSCSTLKVTQKSILGKYQYDGFYGVSSNIELKLDQSFVYNWREGLVFGTTLGKWYINKKTLILNSDLQPIKEEPYQLKEKPKSNSGTYIFKLSDSEDIELSFACCLLRKDTIVLAIDTCDFEGNCVLPQNKEASQIEIIYVGYPNTIIPLSKIKTNSFELKIKTPFFYKYFTNRKWKIKKNRIRDPLIRKSKWVKSPYYEKIR